MADEKWKDVTFNIPALLPLQPSPQEEKDVVPYLQALHNYLADDRAKIARAINVIAYYRNLFGIEDDKPTLANQASLTAPIFWISEDTQVAEIATDVDGTPEWKPIKVDADSIFGDFDYIDFDTTPTVPAHQEGRVHWNDDEGCLNVGMRGGDVELQVGLELLIQCRNISGSQISNGALVKITGATGNKPKIELADATNPWSGYSAIGIATEDIDNNGNGYVTTVGLVRGLDTSAWSEGDALYLDNSTPGDLTNVPPTAPEVATHVGVVVRSHATEGEILCQIVTVPPMTMLADTYGTPASDGEFYVWDVANSRFQIADISDYLTRAEWGENGFEDASDTALAWDDGTRTLTLSPAVTSFNYYYDGVEYTESGNLSATITDTEGLWLFYIGSGGAASLSTIHNPSYEQVEEAVLNECLVAYVYWDATNNDGRLLDERHGVAAGTGKGIPRGVHHYLHEILGAQYVNGMTLGDITVDQAGSADSHAQFSITAGEFYDEDIEHDTLAHASTDTWECYYVDGSGNVRWTDCEATFPVYAIGGVIAYNNAGTLTAVTNNKYICYHVFSTNIHTDAGGDYYPIVTPGTAEYGSKAEAQDAALTEIQGIDFGDWPKEEIIPVATVIYKHLSSMSNGVEAAIQSTEGGDDFVDWRYTAVSGSSTSVNDHGALSGLTDDDHPQYLPLTAGSGRPITGNLHFDNLTYLRARDAGDTDDVNLLVLTAGDQVQAGDDDYTFQINSNGAPTWFGGLSIKTIAMTDHTHTESDVTDLDHYDSTDFGTDFAAKDTDDLSEGSTNLYFTNARADARIAAADIEDLSNVYSSISPADGEVLTWDNANSRWDAEAASGGGGGVPVTTAHTVVDSSTSSTSYVTVVNVSSGPYMLCLVENDDSASSMYVKVTIDGSYTVEIGWISAGNIAIGPGSAEHPAPIFCSSSLKVEIKTFSGTLDYVVSYNTWEQA